MPATSHRDRRAGSRRMASSTKRRSIQGGSQERRDRSPMAYHLSDGPSIWRSYVQDDHRQGLDYTGLHHFGILVDDVEKF